MNDTITLSQLITRLAKSTDVDNNTARRFLKTFFATIEESIEAGETVTVKNLGTFRKAEADVASGRSTIAFIPDVSLLEELNRPFDMFEPVELADGLTFDDEEEAQPVPAPEPVVVAPEPQVGDITDFPEVAPTVILGEDTKPQPEETHVQVETPSPAPVHSHPVIVEHDPIVVPPARTVPADEEDIPAERPVRTRHRHDHHEEEKPSRMWVWAALFLGIACIIGYFGAVWMVPMPDTDYDEEEETIVETPVSDTIPEVEVADIAAPTVATSDEPAVVVPDEPAKVEASVKAPVYDTVEISLIKLAKKHYGAGDYWVFIFDANRDIIKNPNAIRPGTKLLIPDKSELPGAATGETAAIARKKSAEYLNKY